ncbi:MAG: GTP 3',8-cyclase MoaA [Planctomycetota bacterium]|nr:GTP 3',8-cyclase MoaA [Planctomycetota bacterium]
MDSSQPKAIVLTPQTDTQAASSLPRPIGSLVDRYGRVHTSLRVSVTDACNIRCTYCMPEKVSGFLPQDRLLGFDSIARLVHVLVRAGVRKVRLTGGEPLMRPNLSQLVQRLSAIVGLEQLALTTNGMLLSEQIDGLVAAGLTHINLSLDTLREPAFLQISRRDGLDRVLEGIQAAVESPLHVRINALLLRDINLEDCLPLVGYARKLGVVLRFIEFMPLDANRSWSRTQVVTGAEIRELVEAQYGALVPQDRADASQPSRDFHFADGVGGIGLISPVSEPFCSSCNRLRLTADGKFRNCLFGKQEWEVKRLLEPPLGQEDCSDEDLLAVAKACVEQKHASHGISDSDFQPPARAMYQIGG